MRRGAAAASSFAARTLLAACAVLLAAGGAAAGADTGAGAGGYVALADLRPSSAHRSSSRAVVRLMGRHHYRKVPLDDEAGARVLDRYLDFLDPGRSVFLASDVAGFESYRTRIDNALRGGKLDAAFEIFKRYRQRTAERAAAAAALLDREFDFSREETLETGRAEAPWAESGAALEDLWRRRVKNDILEFELTGREPGEALESLRERYARMDRRVRQIDPDDVVQYFLTAYTQSVDPHSTYLSPRSSENFQIRMSLSLEGIGAALRTVGEHTVVHRIVTGGPADRSRRLHPDDKIVGVRQDGEDRMTDIVSWRIEDVVNLIRGPKGTAVHLQIAPAAGAPGELETLSLVRDRIDLEDRSATSRVVETDTAEGARLRIGVVEVPSFYLDIDGRQRGREDYRSTSRDVRRLVGELRSEGVDGLIVDLRGNQGGSLEEAIELTGLFIRTGPVVQIRSSAGRLWTRRDSDPSLVWEGPLGVLVDQGSASSSEIFSGAIQDYRMGLVIGETTYGKGTVQNLVDLASQGGAGRLKLTVAQYFRVSGEGVQLRGVRPDVDFAAVVGAGARGERDLDTALPWAEVEPVEWEARAADEAAADFVRRRSRDRLRTAEPFRLLREESEYRRGLRGQEDLDLHRERRREAHAEAEANQERRLRALRGEREDGGPDADAGAGTDADADTDADAEGGAPGFAELRGELLLEEAVRVVADLASFRTHPLDDSPRRPN